MSNPAKGTWTTSGRDRRCVMGCVIERGDWIYADGSGRWLCAEHGKAAEGEK